MFAPYILAVHPSVPVNSVDELVKYAKANPGKLIQGVSGIGNANHLTGLQLTRALGIDWKFVAYKGGADAIRAVVANESQIIINGATATQSFVVQNQMKGLSVSGEQRGWPRCRLSRPGRSSNCPSSTTAPGRASWPPEDPRRQPSRS